MKKKLHVGPKVLLFDIETIPILAHVWGLWENNVALNQIARDWAILSWSAKWLGDSKIMYEDQRNNKNIEDDKKILQKLWILLDEADVVITQNGKSFDHKKVNARFIQHGMKPPSTYKIIDTKLIAKKHFAFTSVKLEYLTDKLCSKYKKMTKRKFSGFSLWTECLKGNKQAFIEMEKYNKLDVLSLEELYYKLAPWDSALNFNIYHDEDNHVCTCGSKTFKLYGFAYTSLGKFQRYVCKECGKEHRGKVNLLSKEKKASLLIGTKRT